ncbi:hypothetical protein Dimus_015030 [Dionaea muscipula]
MKMRKRRPEWAGGMRSFIKSLEESQKGETTDGIEKLKCYLAHFGYLDNSRCINHYNDDDEQVLDDHKKFDESLEDAIKTYQLNFGLRVTGFMDRDTVNQMMKPRCGYPDIINGRNTMLARGNSNYKLGLEKWHKSTLTYKYIPNGLAPIDIDVRTVFSHAVSEWAQHCPLKFKEVPANANSDIKAIFIRGIPGVFAYGIGPPIGESQYNADVHWSTNPVKGKAQGDLQYVMTHELGHVLGLDHSADRAAVMYPSYDENNIKRRLGKDDIDGIRALYG